MSHPGNKGKVILRSLLALAVSILLLWLLMRKLNPEELWQTIRTGHYQLLWLIALVSFASYWIRVQRWKQLLAGGGYTVQTSDALAALGVGYMVNLLIPRFGELSRSYIIRRRAQVPFEQALGTIILERLVDIVMLLLLCMVSLLCYFNLLYDFAQQHIIYPVNAALQKSRYTMLAAIVVLLFAAGLFYLVRQRFSSGKWQLVLHRFRDGLFSISKVKHPMVFMLNTAGIWICYFLMTWLWCFTFDESSSIWPGSAFVVMIIGTLGRSVPVQGGGIGTYHFLATQAFILFAISPTTAFALAILIHGGQSVFTVLMGIGSFIWLSVRQRVSGQESE